MAEIREFGGLDNQNAETDYGLSRLSVAQNIDITRANKIKLRKGRSKIASASIQSAWSAKKAILYQSGERLYMVDEVGAGRQIAEGLDETQWLTGTEVNNQIFWTNGTNDGVIENGANRELGFRTPELPLYAQTVGEMPAGNYMFTVTLVRADGFESGAPTAGSFMSSEGGIRVGVTLPDGATKARLYLTNCNGSQLYLAGEREGSGIIEYRGNTLDLVKPLNNQFCDRPPRFDHADYYRGAMYYADGATLRSSLPYNYELMDYQEDYLSFPDTIEMVAAVSNGLFIATTAATFFLQGTNIRDFQVLDLFDYGVIKGTLGKILASSLRPNESGDAVMWGSSRGLVLGNGSGSATNLTNGTFHLPASHRGCGGFIEQDGQQRFIVSVRDAVPYNARQIDILANIELPPAEAEGTA